MSNYENMINYLSSIGCDSGKMGEVANLYKLQEENALLTDKLKGLEDIDENRANLRDIILGAIENFEGIGYHYEADDLRKKLDKELNQ